MVKNAGLPPQSTERASPSQPGQPRAPSTSAAVTVPTERLFAAHATTVTPGSFDMSQHLYSKVLHAQVHPMVAYFMRMTPRAIVARYCHLNPSVSRDVLARVLATPTKHLRWAGADMLHATDAEGRRRMVLLETNSCPSGNKAMPPLAEDEDDLGGYGRVLRGALLPRLRRKGSANGRLAVLWDKNLPEASGYAAALAELTGEPVMLTPWPQNTPDAPTRVREGWVQARDEAGDWHDIRAAFRYVTQRPWDRLPVGTRTEVLNPVIGCLAGGRNKLMAAKAYSLYDAQLRGSGLRVRTPRTLRDLRLDEVPMQVERFGGRAVVKNPYSNAGQGVYTVTNQRELDAVMAEEHRYQRFVVQGLIGNSTWSSDDLEGRLFHVGTVPDRRDRIFATDVRVMVVSTPEGFRPVSLYARRARVPLAESLTDASDSWDMLGTNLSVKEGAAWSAETNRLLLMDTRDFNRLGLGLDQLIEAFVQAVLATQAIDALADRVLTRRGGLHKRLFRSLNDDRALVDELC